MRGPPSLLSFPSAPPRRPRGAGNLSLPPSLPPSFPPSLTSPPLSLSLPHPSLPLSSSPHTIWRSLCFARLEDSRSNHLGSSVGQGATLQSELFEHGWSHILLQTAVIFDERTSQDLSSFTVNGYSRKIQLLDLAESDVQEGIQRDALDDGRGRQFVEQTQRSHSFIGLVALVALERQKSLQVPVPRAQGGAQRRARANDASVSIEVSCNNKLGSVLPLRSRLTTAPRKSGLQVHQGP